MRAAVLYLENGTHPLVAFDLHGGIGTIPQILPVCVFHIRGGNGTPCIGALLTGKLHKMGNNILPAQIFLALLHENGVGPWDRGMAPWHKVRHKACCAPGEHKKG